MVNNELTDQVRKRLWPTDFSGGSRIYVLVDSARDNRIYGAVQETYDNKTCLYGGALAPELEMTAPYLVEVEPDSHFVARTLTEGWGESWGIYLESAAGLANLRKHLRQFLTVYEEAGARVIFRYYDPRVLREFLPACSAGELARLFGPVRRFLMEDEDPEAALEFERHKGVVRRLRHNLAAPLEPPETREIATGAEDRPDERHGAFFIRQPHLRALAGPLRVRAITAHMFEVFPEICEPAGEAEVRAAVRRITARAEGHGFHTDSQITQYVQIAFVLGEEFDEDPDLPWAREILADRSVSDADIRIYLLHEAATACLQGTTPTSTAD